MGPTGIGRRRFLLSSLAIACCASVPLRAVVAEIADAGDDWGAFVARMQDLADSYDLGNATRDQLASRGLQYLQTLDIESASFTAAVADAYESGNDFWLWQRMVKDINLNGGILNIDRSRTVQLHDHPGATGILRIISGEVEIWQYDRVSDSADRSTAVLQRTERRILKPGDTAVLSPDKGNIHALKSISAECRMLDFFIPPYRPAQRSWFEPLDKGWKDRERLACRCISQEDYNGA